MKVKPKEVLLNLPVALLFDEPWEIASFAANINAILHGKVRLKVEELGVLGGRHVGLFYLQRNEESQQIHDEFVRLIEQEESAQHGDMSYVPASEDEIAEQYDEKFGDNKLCECGHPYYRHFDTYDNMSAIGCKYCTHHSPNGKHQKEKYCPYFKEDKNEVKDAHPRHEDLYAHALCTDSNNQCDNEMLHLKGEDHCRCGAEWIKGKCAALNKNSTDDDYDENGIYRDWDRR